MATFKHRVTTENRETGEVTETEKHFTIKVKNQQAFYSVFINTIGRMYDLKCVSDYKVMIELCCNAEFNTGIIHMSPHLRKDMLERLVMTTQNFSNSIFRLKGLRLITGDKGTFTINPEIFWVGERNSRIHLLNDEEFMISFVSW